MGLTIHYNLKFKGGFEQAKAKIEALRQAAQDLPFKEVADTLFIFDMKKGEPDPAKIKDHPYGWFMIQAGESVNLPSKGDYTSSITVCPDFVVGFNAWPGEGCEEANFGLCRFAKFVEFDGKKIDTKLGEGWHWGSFCKTQYASNPACGGESNFVLCHATVVALLDKAKELGLVKEVSDPSGFWKSRDLTSLVSSVEEMNKMTAAMTGVLNGIIGENAAQIRSPVSDFPNFRKIGKIGQKELLVVLRELAKSVRRL